MSCYKNYFNKKIIVLQKNIKIELINKRYESFRKISFKNKK